MAGKHFIAFETPAAAFFLYLCRLFRLFLQTVRLPNTFGRNGHGSEFGVSKKRTD